MRLLLPAASVWLGLVSAMIDGEVRVNFRNGEKFVWDDEYKTWETAAFPNKACAVPFRPRLGQEEEHHKGTRYYLDGEPFVHFKDWLGEEDFFPHHESYYKSTGTIEVEGECGQDVTCSMKQKGYELAGSITISSATSLAELGKQRDYYIHMFQQASPCNECESHLESAQMLCQSLSELARTHDSIKLLSLIVNVKADLFGAHHASTLDSKALLARHYHRLASSEGGRSAGGAAFHEYAKPLFDQAVESSTHLYGAQHTNTLQLRLEQALNEAGLSRERYVTVSASESLLFQTWRDACGGDESSRQIALKAAIHLGISLVHHSRGDPQSWNEGEYWLRSIFSEVNTAHASDDKNTFWASDELLEYLSDQGRLAEAEPLLRSMTARKERMKYSGIKEVIMASSRQYRLDYRRRSTDASFLAVLTGLYEEVQEKLLSGLDVNHPDLSGTTLLAEAAAMGDDYLVSLLLKHGSAIGKIGGYYGTALNAAALLGHEKVVLMLLDAGSDINLAAGAPRTAMQAASYGGHLTIVKALLRRGANVNLKGGALGTPLQAAAFHGDVTIVRLLLERGADLNADSGHFGTALQAAAYMGREEIVQELLRHGATIQTGRGRFSSAVHAAVARNNIAVFDLLWKHSKPDVLACNHSLSAAAFYGHLPISHTLLAAEANPNEENDEYGCPILAAVQGQQYDMLVHLIGHGASMNQRCKQKGRFFSPLEAAISMGRASIVQALLEHGADANLLEPGSFVPLHAASEAGLTSIVGLLLEHGADPSIVSAEKEFCTPLHSAIFSEHDDIVDLLLKAGARADTSCGEAGTALHLAANSRGDRYVKLLLARREVDPYALNSRGETPLHIAIDRQRISTVLYMLSKGVEVSKSQIHSLGRLVDLCAAYRWLSPEKSDSNDPTKGKQVDETLPETKKRKEVMQLIRDLVEAGADIDATKGRWRDSALATAAMGVDYELVEFLLDAGANVNAKKSDGSTPLLRLLTGLRYFCHFEQDLRCNVDEQTKVLNRLLDEDADINEATNKGHTALSLACKSGIFDLVRWTVERGAEVNNGNLRRGPPLHRAAFNGRTDIAEYLLSVGADPNLRGQKYGTALVAAAGRGHGSMVRLLLNYGADVGDALQAAEEAGHAEVVELIKSHQSVTRCISAPHDSSCPTSVS